MNLRLLGVAAIAAGMAAATPSLAGTSYTDLGDYNNAVGAHNIITFAGLAAGTIVTNQFAALGATFTDGDDEVELSAVYIADGAGITDHGSTTIQFSTGMNHFGVEFPGAVTIQLYDGATLISSTEFGGVGDAFFGGVLEAGKTFDRVVLFDHVVAPGFYDNLHFGFAVIGVPEPGTLALFGAGLAGLLAARRRAVG